MDKPEVYGLPNVQNAVLPRRNNLPGYLGSLVTAALGMVVGLVAFRHNRMAEFNGSGGGRSGGRGAGAGRDADSAGSAQNG